MVVFFQIYSPWQTLLTLPSLAKAERVVFFHPCPLGEDQDTSRRWKPALVRRLVRMVNASAVMEEISREQLYQLGFYQNNHESDRHVEKLFKEVSRSASFKVMRALVADPALDHFYKIRLLDRIRERTAFARAIPQVLGTNLAGVAIPASRDRYHLDRHVIGPADSVRMVPLLVRTSQWLRDRLARIAGILSLSNLIWLTGVPVIYLALLILRRGLARRSRPIQADVIMPLVWGFAKDGLVRGWKRPDNSYLVGLGLGLERFAFYFADWTFGAEEVGQKQLMDRQGIRYFDPKTFVPPVSYLREAGAFLLRLCAGLLRHPRILVDDPWFAKISAVFLYHYLQARLFADTVDFKVLLEYQDYLSAHVVRTIVANERRRLTVGIHHNAPDGPYGFPVLRYAHINRYCLWGEELLRLHRPHWDRLDHRFIGMPAVDYVVGAQTGGHRRELEDIYRARYGGGRPLAVIFFPSPTSLNVKNRVDALIEGLGRLRELPDDLTVLCRFRGAEQVQEFLERGLERVMAADPRIAVDMTDLTTHEWIALSDLVIVNSISSAMVEAAAGGKPCFAFDNMMLAEIVFARFGADLILKSAEDLVRVFRHLNNGFRGWDCRWDELAKSYCYYADGKNLDRYRQVILDAIADVEARKPAGASKGGRNVEDKML